MDSKKSKALDQYVEALSDLMEHANQEEHHPECPFFERDKKKGASSGATSNAYRNGWDVTFGRGQIGEA